MNKNLRIGTFMVCSALLLTGCGKTVTQEEAGKFIEENYTSKEQKKMNVHTVVDVKKADGIYSKLYEVGKKENDMEATFAPITKLELSVYSEKFIEYKIKGSKLVISYSLSGKELIDFLKDMLGSSIKEDELDCSGSASMEMVYDENGYPEKEVEKANLSFKYSQSGISVEGSVKMTSEITYTFK